MDKPLDAGNMTGHTGSPQGLVILNRLKGGIGNQLFQHVFGLGLARRMNAQLLCDLSFFDGDPYGNRAMLGAYDPSAREALIADLVSLEGAYLLGDGGLRSLSDPLPLPLDARVLVLDGYWQRESLLDPDVVAQIRANLAAAFSGEDATPNGVAIRASAEAVAIHVRRHHYGHMGLCEESYYLGAIEFLRKRIPAARFFVFSDDPIFVRETLLSRHPDINVVASGGDLSDLYLMSLCRHFVIANSSYSWWAAYLAEHRGGLIICPEEWVVLDGALNPCPPRWTRVARAVRAPSISAAAIAAVEAQLSSATPYAGPGLRLP